MATVDEGPTTVSREGVTVMRSTERKPDGVTSEFEVRSDRDSPTSVEVVQEILAGVPDDDVGFHPDREPETWSIENSEVRFEATVAPDEQYVTVLGVRTGGEAIDPLAGRPRIVLAEAIDVAPEDVDSTPEDEPVEEIEGEPFADDGPFAADPTALDEEAPPVRDGGEGDTAADPIRSVSDEDDTGDDEEEGWVETGGDAVIAPPPEPDEESEESSEATERETEPVEFDGTVAEALADELASGIVDDAVKKRLTTQLSPDDLSLRESDQARIDHLQTRTEDFAAYAEVMEAFIDEHGSASEFADEIREDIESFRSDVAGELSELREEIEELDDDLEDIEEDLDDVEEVADSVADLEEELEGLADDIDDLREDQTERIDDLEAHINEFRQLRQGLQTAFGSDIGDADEE